MAKLPEPEAAMAKLPEPEARARLAEEATGKLSEPEAGVEKLMAKTADGRGRRSQGWRRKNS